MAYDGELFGREMRDLPPASVFHARIRPGVQYLSPEILANFFFNEPGEVYVHATTAESTTLYICIPGSFEIRTSNNPNFDEAMAAEDYPFFSPHEERTSIAARGFNGLLQYLNAMDDPSNTEWRYAKDKIDLTKYEGLQ